MVDSPVEESLGSNPGHAALDPTDPVAMGVPADRVRPGFLGSSQGRAFRALAHQPFRLLFIAFLVNQTGFWISHVSLQGLMVELTDNDPFALGQLFFALFIPAFVLAPVAGVVADRFDRQRIMLICYAAVAVLMLALTLLSATHTIRADSMLALSFLLGTAFCFSGPASFAVAANTVPPLDLPSAVSLQSAANNLTRVLGPALAAPLLAARRFEWSFGLFGFAALVAAWLIARVEVRPFQPDGFTGGILARLRAGLSHAKERRPALPALLTVAALSLFGVSHVALLPVFAERVFGSRDVFAWIVAASGVGAMLGALVTGYAHRSTLRGAAIQMALFALSLGGFAIATNLALALAAQVAVGYFYFTVMTHLQTLVQQIVDEDKRGRVMSLFQVAWAGLIPFGGFAMGAVADAAGVVQTLVGAALCCLAIGAFIAACAERWSRPAPG
jgi:MFS family permease